MFSLSARTGSLIACLVCSPVAFADTVLLKNGDRLSGTIGSKENGTLTLTTSYAGKIKLKWSDIRNIVSDQPVTVLLKDDTRITGLLLESEDGSVRIKASRLLESAPIPMSEVRYINPPAIADGKTVLTGKLNVGLDVAKGNTDTEKYHFDGEIIAKTLSNRYTVGAIFNRTADNGRETESNSIGYGKYDHFLNKKWYLYSNALFTRDKFKDLKLRTSLGIGSGYQFYESKRTNLSLEGGINYFNEDFYTAADESYPALRWSTNFDHMLFDTDFQFFHFHEGYIGLEDTQDILIRTQTGLRVPLMKGLNASAQYDFDWDNTPAAGNDREDSRYHLNIGYAW